MAENKPSLYFITTELPWPATSGGKIKTFRFLKFLSEHYEVRLACAHGASDEKTLTELREVSGISSVQVFGKLKPRSAFNWFMAIAQFPTFNCFRVYSKKMESVMRWGIEQSSVTIVDHLEMMEMIPEKLVPNVIYHSHNAEIKLWSDYAKIEANPLKKWVLEWEADRIKVFERWVIKRSKFTFAAPNDRELLTSVSNLDPNKFRLTYHLGDESLLKLPNIDLEGNKQKLLFMGTLSWMPNKDGISWFLNSIWPRVKSNLPEAELVICGTGADQHLLNQIGATDDATHLGFVKDINEIMESCRASIIPLRFGSGMKIKTLDALYRGLPIVSSETGVEGLDIKKNEHALICDSETEWIDNVTKALSQPTETARMAENGRSLVSKQYTYPLIFKAMLTDIKQSIT